MAVVWLGEIINAWKAHTVKPVFKTTWEIGTTWQLRTSTGVPSPIQYMEMDLRNQTTSEFRIIFYSPLGVPNLQVSLYIFYRRFQTLLPSLQSFLIKEDLALELRGLIQHKHLFSSPYCETFVHSVQWTASDCLLASLPLGGAAFNTRSLMCGSSRPPISVHLR